MRCQRMIDSLEESQGRGEQRKGHGESACVMRVHVFVFIRSKIFFFKERVTFLTLFEAMLRLEHGTALLLLSLVLPFVFPIANKAPPPPPPPPALRSGGKELAA